jgi:hypothetical protein
MILHSMLISIFLFSHTYVWAQGPRPGYHQNSVGVWEVNLTPEKKQIKLESEISELQGRKEDLLANPILSDEELRRYIPSIEKAQLNLKREIYKLIDAKSPGASRRRNKRRLKLPPNAYFNEDGVIWLVPKNPRAKSESVASINGKTESKIVSENLASEVVKKLTKIFKKKDCNCSVEGGSPSSAKPSIDSTPPLQLHETEADVVGEKCESGPEKQKTNESKLLKNRKRLESEIVNKYSKAEMQFHPQGAHDIGHACILQAQKNYANNGLFAYCPSSQSNESSSAALAVKPCVSQKYHNLVYNAFTNVMNCFGIDQKMIYPLIKQESGFNMNAFSNSGAGGLGQLTEAAIQDVNDHFFKGKTSHSLFNSDTERVLGRYGSQSAESVHACENLLGNLKSKNADGEPVFRPISSSYGNRCEALAPPDNPQTNLIYSALYHIMSEETFLSAFKNTHLGLRKITTNEQKLSNGRSLNQQLSDRLTPEEITTLRKKLELLSHNSGRVGAETMMRLFLLHRRGAVKASDFKIAPSKNAGKVGGFFAFIKTVSTIWNPKSGRSKTIKKNRRIEVADYFPKMVTGASGVQKNISLTVNKNKNEESSSGQSERSNACIDQSLL